MKILVIEEDKIAQLPKSNQGAFLSQNESTFLQILGMQMDKLA